MEMKYDFDKVLDRRGNHAAKYDERIKKFGTDKVIPLWIADMDFMTAQPIIDALKARAEEGIWGYTSRPDSYFQAVQQWQKRRNGWEPDTALMSYALGVVQSLSAIVEIFTQPGEAVLIQTPVYSEFYDVVEAWGRPVLENKMIERNGVWSVDYDDLDKKLSQASLFLFCSPHNPLGIVWSREELQRITALCAKHHVLMVSDEIHSDLVFWGKKHINTATVSPEAAANTITCLSATKTFNLAGLQASTAIFPNREMKQRFDGFWRKMDIHRNNAFSLTAMETAFRQGEEWLEQLKPYLEGNLLFIRDYCAKYIPKIVPNLPDATYLVWLDCRALGLDNSQLHDFMIQKAGLGLNDGCSFGRSLSGYMRLNAACPRSVLEKALDQLRRAVDEM
jgi:cystathionine beta-lyase